MGDMGEFSHIPVPCGKCVDCHKDRSRQWFVRLKYELKEAISAYFITLTYATPPISPNGYFTGRKEDLQNFLKRLRYYDLQLSAIPRKKTITTSISYYAVLEYGEHYQRPIGISSSLTSSPSRS